MVNTVLDKMGHGYCYFTSSYYSFTPKVFMEYLPWFNDAWNCVWTWTFVYSHLKPFSKSHNQISWMGWRCRRNKMGYFAIITSNHFSCKHFLLVISCFPIDLAFMFTILGTCYLGYLILYFWCKWVLDQSFANQTIHLNNLRLHEIRA